MSGQLKGGQNQGDCFSKWLNILWPSCIWLTRQLLFCLPVKALPIASPRCCADIPRAFGIKGQQCNKLEENDIRHGAPSKQAQHRRLIQILSCHQPNWLSWSKYHYHFLLQYWPKKPPITAITCSNSCRLW